MITIGQLRTVSRLFLNLITRDTKIKLDDIRFLKFGTGVMPQKLIKSTDPVTNITTTKEVPYLNDDEFIIFDVIVKNNIASEVVNDQFKSHMPFTLIVNIYGDEASDELQYMMSRISNFSVRHYLTKSGFSIEKEPDDFQVLDGKENGIWWVRRRIEINLNTEQSIDISSTDGTYEFDTVEHDTKILSGDDE